MVFGATQRLSPGTAGGGPLEDMAGHRRRPYEGHPGHAGVVDEGIHRHGVAVHHREDTLGETGLPPQVGNQHRGGRVASDGLRTKALPQAIDTGYIHMGTMTGKLKGVIPATTPSGWRRERASTPLDTSSENSPFNRCGIPQANSTTSRPRATSPRASSVTFPCSAVMSWARSSRWRSTSSRKANRTRARTVSEASRHSARPRWRQRRHCPRRPPRPGPPPPSASPKRDRTPGRPGVGALDRGPDPVHGTNLVIGPSRLSSDHPGYHRAILVAIGPSWLPSGHPGCHRAILASSWCSTRSRRASARCMEESPYARTEGGTLRSGHHDRADPPPPDPRARVLRPSRHRRCPRRRIRLPLGPGDGRLADGGADHLRPGRRSLRSSTVRWPAGASAPPPPRSRPV